MTESTQFIEPARILVVDDTPDNLMLLHAMLRDLYTVKVANNGERALLLASQQPQPDLILLDIMMPGIDGYQVCQQLKQNPETTHIPIIFLTAKSEDSDEELGLSLGAVDYIAKPIKAPIGIKIHFHGWPAIGRDSRRERFNLLLSKMPRQW